jgi:hypothetical protein
VRQVDRQDVHSSSADAAAAHEARPVVAEVSSPVFAPWVKQWDEPACYGIEASNVRTLMIVAGETGESQVLGYCRAAVLLRDHMVDLEWELVERLRNPTVLARMTRPLPDQPLKGQTHSEDQAARL